MRFVWFWVALAVYFAPPVEADAQTAAQIQDGFVTTIGCPSANLTPCWMPWSLANPLPTTGSTPSSPGYFKSSQYTALGYCQLSTTLSSAVGLSTCSGGIPTGATTIEACVSTQGISYRDDGTAPTATVGMLIPSGSCFPYAINPLTAIQFIQQSSGAILNVSFYK